MLPCQAGGADTPVDLEYRNLIFAFIDNVKPYPKKEAMKGRYQPVIDILEN